MVTTLLSLSVRISDFTCLSSCSARSIWCSLCSRSASMRSSSVHFFSSRHNILNLVLFEYLLHYCIIAKRAALISDTLYLSLFVQPFFAHCLSASHLAASMRWPEVNSIRWLAKITLIRMERSNDGNIVFLTVLQSKNDVSFNVYFKSMALVF